METFLAVAEERSFSRAAARLHRTQPAVSQAIAKLEGELGELPFRPDDAQGRSMVVYRDELAFVVSRRHALAGAGKVSIRQLGAQNFIAHNIPSPQRQKVIQTFKRHKTPLQMGVELPSLE